MEEVSESDLERISTIGEESEGFVKTIDSDLDHAEALGLLLRAREHTRILNIFDDEDLAYLGHIMTFLKFSKIGETIVRKGEEASFVALIMKGHLNVRIPALDKMVSMEEGESFGEMAYFEHANRNADVETGTEDVIIGLITFDELDNLQESEPTLHSKLTHMLAASSIEKLRGQVERHKTSLAEQKLLLENGPQEANIKKKKDPPAPSSLMPQRRGGWGKMRKSLFVNAVVAMHAKAKGENGAQGEAAPAPKLVEIVKTETLLASRGGHAQFCSSLLFSRACVCACMRSCVRSCLCARARASESVLNDSGSCDHFWSILCRSYNRRQEEGQFEQGSGCG